MRCRHCGDGPHRFRRTRGAPRLPSAGRRRPSLAVPLLGGHRRRTAHRCGHPGPSRLATLRAGRGNRDRAPRRSRLHRHRAPTEDGLPMRPRTLSAGIGSAKGGPRAVPAPLPSRPAPPTVALVAAARRRRRARAGLVITLLTMAIAATFCVSLMVGRTFYPPDDVFRVLAGQEVSGASFTVGRLRLPRAVLAALAGICFGLGGVTFQTMLRNPLASPGIIGISSGASAAAAFGIVVLGLSGPTVSLLAITAGLGVALIIYHLSYRGGVMGSRLILVGIGRWVEHTFELLSRGHLV